MVLISPIKIVTHFLQLTEILLLTFYNIGSIFICFFITSDSCYLFLLLFKLVSLWVDSAISFLLNGQFSPITVVPSKTNKKYYALIATEAVEWSNLFYIPKRGVVQIHLQPPSPSPLHMPVHLYFRPHLHQSKDDVKLNRINSLIHQRLTKSGAVQEKEPGKPWWKYSLCLSRAVLRVLKMREVQYVYVLSLVWPPIGRQIEIIPRETRKDLYLLHFLHLALFKTLSTGCVVTLPLMFSITCGIQKKLWELYSTQYSLLLEIDLMISSHLTSKIMHFVVGRFCNMFNIWIEHLKRIKTQ